MVFAGRRSQTAPAGNRVLIIVENLPVPFDRRVWLEALALTEAGYHVCIICPKMKGFVKSRETISNIEIYRHPLPYEAVHGALGFLIEYTTALIFEFWLALKIYMTRGLDVIHACNPPDTIFLIGLFFKLFGVRFIFDQHDINPELYLAKYSKKDAFYRLLLHLEKATYQTANVVISTNQSYRSIAQARGHKSADQIFIVRSAPDTSKFKSVLPNPSLKMGRPYLVCYLGVMGKQEGLDLLLESIRIIVHGHNRHDISFALIGGGPELATIREMADKLAISSHVSFTGRIPDDELLTYLSTADVCVNPDRVNEMNDKSTMNKIMEYMAVAKPMVQFDMTEGRYSAGEASLYAIPNDPTDFAEKILALIHNDNLRRTMGDAGLRRLNEKFDWQFSKVELLKAYRKVMEARS